MHSAKKYLLIFALLFLSLSLFACSQDDTVLESEIENGMKINLELDEAEPSNQENQEKISLDRLIIDIYQEEQDDKNKIINKEIQDLDSLADLKDFNEIFTEEIQTEEKYLVKAKLFANLSHDSDLTSSQAENDEAELLYQGETATEIVTSELTTTSSANIKEVAVELEKLKDETDDDESEDTDDKEDEDENNDEDEVDDEPEDTDDNDGDEPVINILEADNIELDFYPIKTDIKSGDEFDVKFADTNDTSFITWTHDLAEREFSQASSVEAVEAVDDMEIGVISKKNMEDILEAENEAEDLADENYHEDKLITEQDTEIAKLKDKLPDNITIYDSIEEDDRPVDVIWDTEDFSTNQSGSQIIYGTLDLDPEDYKLDSKPKISLEVFLRVSGYSLDIGIETDEEGGEFDDREDSMSEESGEISYVETEQIGKPPIELEANANSSWRFIEWKEENELGDDKTHTSNPAKIELADGDSKEVFARFRKLYQIDSSIESSAGGKGELEFDPHFRNYEAGENIEIEAIAKEGSRFVEWEFDQQDNIDQDENELAIDSIVDDLELTASFEAIHQISTRSSPPRSGEIEIDEADLYDDGKVYHESEVNLAAEPERGWEFVTWSSDDFDEIDGAEDEEITIDSVKDDLSIVANFEREEYSITTAAANDEGGVVEAEEQTLEFESETELTATANEGWEFVDWDLNNIAEIDEIDEISDIAGIDNSEQRTLTIESVEADYDFIANFQREEYSITTDTEGEGSVEPEEKTVEFESEAELTATADDGWEFVNWSSDDLDEIDGAEDEEITIDSVESDLELTANFAETDDNGEDNGD